jgi:hypothetical protein
LLIAVVLSGCVGSVFAPAPLRVPPPSAALRTDGPREIHPGVLRALMTEGSLVATFESETSLDEKDATGLVAYIRVCLDRDGNATAQLVGAARSAAFTKAALDAVSTWRFFPYVDAGKAQPACSLARFHYAPTTKEPEPALPEPRVELPLSVEEPYRVPADLISRRPTPGVAFARLCRTRGSRAAPRFALLQSSGDPAFDRSLFEERATAPAHERPPAVEECWLRAGLAQGRGRMFDLETHAVDMSIAPRDVEEPTRVSGDKYIFPSDSMKNEIRDSSHSPITITVEVDLCIDTSGRPFHVKVLKTSGYFPYDMDLVNGVAAWRYGPVATPFCTTMQFIYRQKW